MRFPLISYPWNPTFYTLKTLGDTPNPNVSGRKSCRIFFLCLRHIMHYIHLIPRNVNTPILSSWTENLRSKFAAEGSQLLFTEKQSQKFPGLFYRVLPYDTVVSNNCFFIITKGEKWTAFYRAISPLETPFTSQRLGASPKTPFKKLLESLWLSYGFVMCFERYQFISTFIFLYVFSSARFFDSKISSKFFRSEWHPKDKTAILQWKLNIVPCWASKASSWPNRSRSLRCRSNVDLISLFRYSLSHTPHFFFSSFNNSLFVFLSSSLNSFNKSSFRSGILVVSGSIFVLWVPL